MDSIYSLVAWSWVHIHELYKVSIRSQYLELCDFVLDFFKKKWGRGETPPPYFTCNTSTWGYALINSFTVRQWDVLSKLTLSPFRIKTTRTQLEPPLWNPWFATDLLLDVSWFPFVIKSLIVYVQFSILLFSSMVHAYESSTWSMYV